MTDSVDGQEDDDSSASPVSDVESHVPDDTGWKLETQIHFDQDANDELTSTIIVGVAEAEGVSPMDIKDPPLYEVLDVAALEDSLFGSATIGRGSDERRSVEFMYRGHRIVVRSDAWVQIFEAVEP